MKNTIELTDKQKDVLQNFISEIENKFYSDTDIFDNKKQAMFFNNDVNFSCDKKEFQSLKQAFFKILE